MDRRIFLKCLSLSYLSSYIALFGEGLTNLTPLRNIPILLYHEITYSPINDYTVFPEDFYAQMEYIYNSGLKTAFIDKLDMFQRDTVVIITFDDGSFTFLEYAYPILKAYKFKAVLNLVGSWIGRKNCVSWDELSEITKEGLVQIGCHSYDFHYPGWSKSLSLMKFKDDLKRFKEVIGERLGLNVKIFASPFGEILGRQHLQVLKELDFDCVLLSDKVLLTNEYQLNIYSRINVNYKHDMRAFAKILRGEVP